MQPRRTAPGFDYRRMCPAGRVAAEAAHARGDVVATCPGGNVLKVDAFGIWYVATEVAACAECAIRIDATRELLTVLGEL